MVAAKEDREALLDRAPALFGQHLGPADGFGQVVDGMVGADGLAQRRQGGIAPVLDAVSEFGDGTRQSGDAERRRAHQAAFAFLAGVDRGADQDAVASGREAGHCGLLLSDDSLVLFCRFV